MSESTVCVIDDDPSVRSALDSLLRSLGHRVEAFSSPADFLARHEPRELECLILDVRMPGANGLDFQRRLTDSGNEIPVVFLSGHADVPIAVQAMKAGAVEFLTKPYREQDLLDAIGTALQRDQDRRMHVERSHAQRQAHARLTRREQEVMSLVVTGLMNKQIAAELGLSEVTVKMHRGRVMRKMGAHTVPELVRTADLIGLAQHPASAKQR